MKRFIFGKKFAAENEQTLVEQAAQVNEEVDAGAAGAAVSAIDFDKEIESLKNTQDIEDDNEPNLLDDAGDDTSGSEDTTPEEDSAPSGDDNEQEPESSDDSEDESEQDDTDESDIDVAQAQDDIADDKQAATEALISHVIKKLSIAAETIEQGHVNGYVSPNVRKLVDKNLRECASMIGATEVHVMSAENASNDSFFKRIKDMIVNLIKRIKDMIKTGYNNVMESISNFNARRGVFEKNMAGYERRLQQLEKIGNKKGITDWPTVKVEPPVVVIKDRDTIQGYHDGIISFTTFVSNMVTTFAEVPGYMGRVSKLIIEDVKTNGADRQGFWSSNGFEEITKPSKSGSLLTRNVKDVEIHNQPIAGSGISSFDVVGILGYISFRWGYASAALNTLPTSEVAAILARTSFHLDKTAKHESEEIVASPENGLALASLRNVIVKCHEGMTTTSKIITSGNKHFVEALQEVEKLIESTDDNQHTLTTSLRLTTNLVSSFETSYLQPLRAATKVCDSLMRSLEKSVATVVSANQKGDEPM